MPRYIDADALLLKINLHGTNKFGMLDEDIREFVKQIPTADVVPRVEVEYWKEQCFHACMNNGGLDKAIVKAAVAREIFEEIEKIRAKEIRKCEYFRQKENDASERKYWEGGEHSLLQLSYWISDLKKKYTEGKE